MNPANDQVMVEYNANAMQDMHTVIARTKDFLFHNPMANKCLQVDVEKPELLQCGSGGNVTFTASNQPDPNLKILKRNPGSVDNPELNADPCGPLKPDPEPFMFKKNAQLNELIVS